MFHVTLNPEESIKKKYPNVTFNFNKQLCKEVIDLVVDSSYRNVSGCFGGFFTKYSSEKNYVAHYFENDYNECVKKFGMDIYVMAKLDKQADDLVETDWFFVLNESVQNKIKVTNNLYHHDMTVPRLEVNLDKYDFRIVIFLVAGELARKNLINYDYFPAQIYYDYSLDEILLPIDFLNNTTGKELPAIMPNNGLTDQENRKRVLRIKKMIFKGFHFNKDVLNLVLNYK